MSTYSLVDATTWVHGYDMTTDLNQISINAEVEDQENTTFGSGGFRSRVGGLRSVSADLAGYWQSAVGPAIDSEAFNALGQRDRVVTMAYDDAEDVPAYFFQAGEFSYDMFGSIGDVTPFNLSMLGTSGYGLVRGRVAKAKATVNATGATGSVLNLGQVAANQFLYASLHVFGTPGTTITVQVQSDDSAGFGSPTTRLTLGPITAAGGTWATRLAGAVTDTHYRFNISAITGSFSIAGAIGIGS